MFHFSSVTDIKYNSPAHTSGKIEDGDEIVQINYQTVVGWQSKKVIDLLQESSPDILITLKKRPKHTKIYGQIYMKPYRLPSKKKTLPGRWGEALPSPHTNLAPMPETFPSVPLTRVPEKHASSDSDCSDILTPTNPNVSDKDLRLYLPKPRAVLQRRNTICGEQVDGFKNNVLFWHEKKCRENNDDSPSLRDKSASFGFGLEITPRPTTCLGIGNSKYTDFGALKGSLPDIPSEKIKTTTEKTDELSFAKPIEINGSEEQISKPGISKMVRFDSMKEVVEYKDTKYSCNVENTILEVFEPIPYVDEEELNTPNDRNQNVNNSIPLKDPPWTTPEAVNQVLANREKTKIDFDTPPAIEPRKEYLQKTPPAPPPRPRKMLDASLSLTIPPPPPPIQLKPTETPQATETKLNTDLIKEIVQPHNETLTPQKKQSPKSRAVGQISSKIPATKHFLEECFDDLEILTPPKGKNLTLKKKNSIMAKRRNISLKMLEMSDIQGYLYRRSKDKHGVTYWAKLFFVLADTSLYGFKTKESPKAGCLIFLPGFTVSIAKEVHSKPYAFKVYHPTKTFYFAAESHQALGQWLEYIKLATLKGNTNTLNVSTDQNIKELYSETESSDGELDVGNEPKQFATPSPVSGTKSGSKSKSHSDDITKSEKYHLGFGSLKKFTKHSLPFSSSSSSSSKNDKDKKNSSDVPVPTAQYRSYRKVPGNAGLQLGTSSMISSTGNADFIPPTLSINDSSYKIDLVPNPNPIYLDSSYSFATKTCKETTSKSKGKSLRKTSPYNYIHASNPNLVEFDFPTSKTLDFSFPRVNPSNSWDAHHNLQGFVTLKDLMLQKQEEDAQEMYNHRVVSGIEKIGDRLHRRKLRRSDQTSHAKNDDTMPKQNVDKIQSRSLPKTPDYAQSFKPDDSDIIMTRSREGQKLRDFGYEFISGEDPIENQIPKSTVDRINSSSRKKGLNWINMEKSNKTDEEKSNRGSFKKSKNKLVVEKFESFKTSSEKLFQFKHTNDKDTKEKDKLYNLKPATSYSPLTLPLNKKSSHVYNIHVDGGGGGLNNSSVPVTNLKKSNTYNTPDFRDGIQMPSQRKNSAPERSASYFTKLTFSSNKSAKEKRLLGSPRLHRAIFGRRESETQQLDHELFSSVELKVIILWID